MLPLSKFQVSELIETLEFFNSLFISQNIGGEFLSQSDKNILTRRGIDWRELKNDYVDYAYKFGQLAEALRDKNKVKNLTFAQLKKFIGDGKYLPLTTEQNYALNIVKTQMFKDINKLKDKQIDDLYQINIDINRKAEYDKILRQEAAKAISNKESARELAVRLAERTKEWGHNFDRIADYIMHSAYQHGKANFLLTKLKDPKVWYSVKPDACKYCKKVYLNRNGEPKIFRLLTVLANGSNIGVKPDKYKPSAYPLHPHCRCDMQEYVENTVWDSVRNRFVLARNTYNVKRKSKIKITINRGE